MTTVMLDKNGEVESVTSAAWNVPDDIAPLIRRFEGPDTSNPEDDAIAVYLLYLFTEGVLKADSPAANEFKGRLEAR